VVRNTESISLCSRPPNFRMAANMSAGKLGPPDSSDAPPTPLEARSVHTTRIIESHLTWVAKQNRHRRNSRFLMESPPPDIGVGAAEPHLPDFFSRQGFFCSTGKIISCPRISGICCLFRARLVPKQEERHSPIPGLASRAIIAAMLCAPLAQRGDVAPVLGPTPLWRIFELSQPSAWMRD
jgi:hypothetical protein